MSKNLTIIIDDDLYEKFCIALNLTKETPNQAIEQCIRGYTANAFEEAARTYNPEIKTKSIPKETTALYGKANNRIPHWALKPNQYNHKIIRAFFKAEQLTGQVTKANMERLCSDKLVPELYVPTFRSNYAQMKLDEANSHGKVFEDDGNIVNIWSEVRDTLLRYKKYFC